MTDYAHLVESTLPVEHNYSRQQSKYLYWKEYSHTSTGPLFLNRPFLIDPSAPLPVWRPCRISCQRNSALDVGLLMMEYRRPPQVGQWENSLAVRREAPAALHLSMQTGH